MLLKQIPHTGNLRDYFLLCQQRAENEIEYLKIYIQVQASFRNVDDVNKALGRFRELLAFEKSKDSKQTQDWMNDPEKVKEQLNMLSQFKVTIG